MLSKKLKIKLLNVKPTTEINLITSPTSRQQDDAKSEKAFGGLLERCKKMKSKGLTNMQKAMKFEGRTIEHVPGMIELEKKTNPKVWDTTINIVMVRFANK